MIIHFRRVVLHYLLRVLHRVLSMQFRRLTLIRLLFWVLINEQIFDLSFPRRCLVDSETGSKLSMRADLDRVQ